MKVLLVTQYYAPEPGAASVRLQAMVRQMSARGHDVEVVTALPNYPTGSIYPEYRGRVARTEFRDGARVRRYWVYPAIGSGPRRLIGFATFTVSALIGMLRAGRPDVVLVESPPPTVALPALLYRLVTKVPYVFLVADLWPDTGAELGLFRRDGLTFRLMRRLEDLTYRRALAVSPVTDRQVEILTADKGVASEDLAFLPNGVDVELFAPRENGEHPRTTVLIAGTLGYSHGLDVVLDAAQLVGQQRPEIRFLFVGGGSDRERLEARVRSEGLANVEFRDPIPVEDVAPLAQECLLGVASIGRSPMLEGARPARMFPVMACGRPVVYSGRGEGAELIRRSGSGVVTPLQDAPALAAAILRIGDDPDGAREMGERGRAFVLEHLSWARLVDEWLAMIESRLAAARVDPGG